MCICEGAVGAAAEVGIGFTIFMTGVGTLILLLGALLILFLASELENNTRVFSKLANWWKG